MAGAPRFLRVTSPSSITHPLLALLTHVAVASEINRRAADRCRAMSSRRRSLPSDGPLAERTEHGDGSSLPSLSQLPTGGPLAPPGPLGWAHGGTQPVWSTSPQFGDSPGESPGSPLNSTAYSPPVRPSSPRGHKQWYDGRALAPDGAALFQGRVLDEPRESMLANMDTTASQAHVDRVLREGAVLMTTLPRKGQLEALVAKQMLHGAAVAGARASERGGPLREAATSEDYDALGLRHNETGALGALYGIVRNATDALHRFPGFASGTSSSFVMSLLDPGYAAVKEWWEKECLNRPDVKSCLQQLPPPLVHDSLSNSSLIGLGHSDGEQQLLAAAQADENRYDRPSRQSEPDPKGQTYLVIVLSTAVPSSPSAVTRPGVLHWDKSKQRFEQSPESRTSEGAVSLDIFPSHSDAFVSSSPWSWNNGERVSYALYVPTASSYRQDDFENREAYEEMVRHYQLAIERLAAVMDEMDPVYLPDGPDLSDRPKPADPPAPPTPLVPLPSAPASDSFEMPSWYGGTHVTRDVKRDVAADLVTSDVVGVMADWRGTPPLDSAAHVALLKAAQDSGVAGHYGLMKYELDLIEPLLVTLRVMQHRPDARNFEFVVMVQTVSLLYWPKRHLPHSLADMRALVTKVSKMAREWRAVEKKKPWEGLRLDGGDVVDPLKKTLGMLNDDAFDFDKVTRDAIESVVDREFTWYSGASTAWTFHYPVLALLVSLHTVYELGAEVVALAGPYCLGLLRNGRRADRHVH